MRQLSPTGEKIIEEIAARHGFGAGAVSAMLEALVRGGGTMAQFSHPEFGGSGQWLRGGMIMIGDMFNNGLKSRVDALCSELAALVANAPDGGDIFVRAPQPPAQSQSQSQGGSHGAGGGDAFTTWQSQSGSGGNWWPADLGSPASVGAQNDMRYAYFPDKRRLALWHGGRVELLDTGEHRISGFGQQQGGSDSITLSSQLGAVPLASLKRIEAAAKQVESSKAPDFAGAGPAATPAASPAAAASAGSGGESAALLSLLEKLGELRDKGLISEDEFSAKKAELLKRV
jgi:hypothetical protein